MTRIKSYSSPVVFESEADRQQLLELLESARFCWNECSKVHFGKRGLKGRKNSIVTLHRKFYKKFRREHPHIPAQVVIAQERSCLAAYKSAKASGHRRAKAPFVMKNPSLIFDTRLYRYRDRQFYFTTLRYRQRIKIDFIKYDKLNYAFDNYKLGEPSLFIKNNIIYINLSFHVEVPLCISKKCTGIDLGIRRFAALSSGIILQDKVYLKNKRRIRYLKRCLQSKGSKSAKRHKNKIKSKEWNQTKNFCHHLSKRIVQLSSDTIVMEDLSNIKQSTKKANKYKNLNRISQAPFRKTLNFIMYKAALAGKRVVLVNPAYTSQIDSVTGKKQGVRKGCRFYAKNGLVYDADINAARNIAKRAKLPVSYGNILDGQALVSEPIVNISRLRILQS